MLYYLKSAGDDFTETDAKAKYARFEARLNDIPDPPSFLFDWDEKQDMEDMTGLSNINLTS